MKNRLEGVAVEFYRGIGSDTQYITPFADMNFFIGPNNSGKSIVLNLLSDRLAGLLQEQPPLDAAEVFRGRETGTFGIGIAGSVDDLVSDFRDRAVQRYSYYGPARVKDVQRSFEFILEKLMVQNKIWVTRSHGSRQLLHQPPTQDMANWVSDWNLVWRAAVNHTGGDILQHWIPGVINYIIAGLKISIPPVKLIPAKRIMGPKGETFEDLSGKGLIDRLAELQNPSFTSQGDRLKFEKINKLLKEITSQPKAQLEVPSNREHLLVHMNDKVLPLHALGTGIHEVVLIAAFCTLYDDTILCIEEPEIHLHPLLQRKLINYLKINTSNQYFIATHSPSFIDTPNSNIFHVSSDGDQTRIKVAIEKNDQRLLLDDLGCLASDILQANAVIWVEGPSDRIYLNHWIKSKSSDLLEGIHYTIMFYGGALIKHLSASDDALEDFIELRRLNRNMAMVLDSDKSAAGDPLKPAAERIVEEMTSGGGLVWVTAGREVENYVDPAVVQAALRIIHPRLYRKPSKLGQFDNSFHFYRQDPKNPNQSKIFKEGDKVGIARIVAETKADFTLLDLDERVTELVRFIKSANANEHAGHP